MLLTRDQIKNNVVRPALQKVADFSGDFEDYSFQHFGAFHKTVFLNALKLFINEHPHPLPNKYYDVTLNTSILAGWQVLRDCVNYIDEEHFDLTTPSRNKL